MSGGLTLTPEQARAALTKAGATFSRFVDKTIFDIGYYRPDGVDHQTPHARDEAYVIALGSSDFWREGETVQVAAGDMIFVEAGVDHRFVNFSDDFAAWVIFFGPKPPEA